MRPPRLRARTAAAYTVGSDIVFGAGIYRPHSHEGQTLLAHELAHVVQQNVRRAQRYQRVNPTPLVPPIEPSEVRKAAVGLAAPVSMQRQPLTGNVPDVDLTESASPLLASAIGSVTLDGFTTGQADVSHANQKKLARTAGTILKLLRKYPASKIQVLGYTDAVGQETDNQTLGQWPADAVQAALVDTGIPGMAIQVESRGAADPVVKDEQG
jgi:outer membrane protein OmpA-like peptidoglycan-associated protein